MKFVSTMILFILFSSLLEASYMRSIRVGSFLQQSAASNSLRELDRFIDSSYRLSDLRNEFNFQTKTIRSGRYYVTVIEPVTDRRAVQEILDIVRTIYPHAYPKKIKRPSRSTHKVKPKPIQHKYMEVLPEENTVNYLEQIEKIDTLIEEEPIKKVATHKATIIEEPTVVLEEKQTVTPEVETKVIQESHKRFELKRTASLAPVKEEPIKENKPFNFFGYEISMIDFSQIKIPEINFDFFTSKEKADIPTKHITPHDSEHGKLSIFETYKLEILGVLSFFFILILLKLFAMYRGHKEDQISIQDIYN